MLLRYDPFREMERSLDQFLGSSIAKGGRMMPMDVYKVGEEAVVRLDLPGIRQEDVEITVEKNVLTVKAERYFPDEQAEVLVSERPQGTFTRQLVVSDSLDTEQVNASYEAGVLTLRIPVSERSKPRKIQLATTEAQPGIEASEHEASGHKSSKEKATANA